MQKKYPSELTKVLQTRFPLFSKICLCYVNNPLYGVDISPEAKDWLNRMNFEKYGINREEVTAEEAKRVQWYLENHFDNIKNMIIWMALQHEEPMHTDVSEADSDLQDNV